MTSHVPPEHQGREDERREAHDAESSAFSAEQTERHVQDLVVAAGRTKSFPHDACLELHVWTRGVPAVIDRVVERILKSEGPATVLPGHVREAAADVLVEICGTDATSEVPSKTPAEAAAKPAAPTTAAVPRAPVPPAASTSESPAGPQRSKEDPEVSEWISRFVGSTGPPAIGSRAVSKHIQLEPDPNETPAVLEARSVDEARRTDEAPSEDEATARAERVRPARRRASPKLRLQLGENATSFVIGSGLVLLAVVSWILVSRIAIPGRSEPTTPPVRVAAREPDLDLAEEASDSGVSASGDTTVLDPSAASPTRPQRSASRRGPAPATILTIPKPPPESEKMGIEVASYIRRDRANQESRRLARITGMPTVILTSQEDGATMYRVVLGSFEDVAEAELAADRLVSRDQVNQARVVPLPKQDEREGP